ncbi:MAG TPA: efflux RND transporter permease subunit [Azospirillaceae bacterium]|nr:efflux RND transporter permease subunit [Azospirillaceae bacterium]
MNATDLFIRRPVLATVLSLLLVLLGLVSFTRLSIREYPRIEEPTVSITTTYPGASAEIIESQVTQIIEGEVAGIEGIDTITSSSRQERSRITIRFTLDTDPDVAASDVRDRVGRVRGQLPDEVDEPVVAKVEADAQPIIYIAFRSDRMSVLEISDYLDRYVRDRMQNLPGVAEAQIIGERRYAMRVWLDRARLASYDLTVQDVEAALRGQNVEAPAGRVESRDVEFTVLARTGLVTPGQFADIVVKEEEGFQVRLGDVGRVELGAEDERRLTRFNGQSAVSVGIVRQAVANPLEVSEGVAAVLPTLELPEGMAAEVANDSSVFIKESIDAVVHTIVEAVILVVAVILLFLRSPRATLVPLVTIPVSLIATFALMLVLGFSINTLTLLAMVLAIGLVVDDAIVVLENVHKKMEQGLEPMRAASVGTREIFFAVIAMTLTLAAVYAPIGFTPGRTGKLFTEFALTLAGAVLVSGLVALTLTPMMCSRLLKVSHAHEGPPRGWTGRLSAGLERMFVRLETAYRHGVERALAARLLVVVLALATAAGGWLLFGSLRSELAPTEDRGLLLTVGQGPEGSTVDHTLRYGLEVAKVYEEVPEVRTRFLVVGNPEVNQMIAFGRLAPWGDRERTQQEIVDEVRAKLDAIPGLRAFPNNPPSLGGSARSQPVEFIIQSSRPYPEIKEWADRIVEKARGFPGLVNPDIDLRLNKPQLEVEVDRAKVADVGLEVAEVGRTLQTFLGGRQITRFNKDGEQYDVIVQVEDADRQTPQDLSEIYVRSGSGEMVQLSNLVRVVETVAPRELGRFNQLRAVTITANLAPGYALGDGLAFLEQAAAEVLPADAQVDYSGQSREFKQTGSSAALTFALALAFIYLVLAAQFESWVTPAVIMVTVPLSLAGALLALKLSGGTLNVYSQIGLVTLVGLITKHGILITEFANQLQERGMGKAEAVVEAASLRLRPILMTTGAMVLGAVPLAIATGAGAESRQDIGWVIVGGMTFGTLLTLFVVPVAYLLLAPRPKSAERAASGDPVGGARVS